MTVPQAEAVAALPLHTAHRGQNRMVRKSSAARSSVATRSTHYTGWLFGRCTGTEAGGRTGNSSMQLGAAALGAERVAPAAAVTAASALMLSPTAMLRPAAPAAAASAAGDHLV